MNDPHGNNEKRSPGNRDDFWTIPNIIGMGRLVGSLLLIGIALAGWPFGFIAFYILLAVSDWIDGFLARRLNQRSESGAHIDSMADLTLNTCLLVGVAILTPQVIQQETAWIALAVVSYLLNVGYGLHKFRRIPSYHPYSAKITHGLVVFAAFSLVLGWSVWPMRIAAIAATLTNLECLVITRRLGRYQADVPSLFHAARSR
jgi:CDP-diacylglycerol--glycerol-3-phosphate 3-phosphatidyltransferase